MNPPFAPGSIVYKPYVVDGAAPERIADLLAQSQAAERAGFDGIALSEHHLGFPGYLPNPLQAVGWVLGATASVWAAPAPMLPLLRPIDLVAEELAWLAARYPGRVGAGFAAGSIAADFALAGTDQRDLAARFEVALVRLSGVLSGRGLGDLAADPAVAALAGNPIAVVSAASSATACRRAARAGCGILLESAISRDEVRRLVDVFVNAGGSGPIVAVRRVWVGDSPPVELERARDALVRAAVPVYDRRAWVPPEQVIVAGSADRVVDELRGFCAATGVGCLNLRVHVPGLAPAAVIDQIRALSAVLGGLRVGR